MTRNENGNSRLWGIIVPILLITLAGLGALNTMLLNSVEKRIDISNRQLEIATSQLWNKIDRVVSLFESERSRVMQVMEKMGDKVSAQGECLSKVQAEQEARIRREIKQK